MDQDPLPNQSDDLQKLEASLQKLFKADHVESSEQAKMAIDEEIDLMLEYQGMSRWQRFRNALFGFSHRQENRYEEISVWQKPLAFGVSMAVVLLVVSTGAAAVLNPDLAGDTAGLVADAFQAKDKDTTAEPPQIDERALELALQDISNGDEAIIYQVTDNFGNVSSNSFVRSGARALYWDPAFKSGPVSVGPGDVVELEVTADEDAISYRYAVGFGSGGSFETIQDWSRSNTVRYTVPIDFQDSSIRFKVEVRSGNETDDQYGFDDYTIVEYQRGQGNISGLAVLGAQSEVELNATESQPKIVEVRDSEGNIITDSIESNGVSRWSGYGSIVAGDTITFEMEGLDGEYQRLAWQNISTWAGTEFVGAWGENLLEFVVPEDMAGDEIKFTLSLSDTVVDHKYGEFGDDFVELVYRVEADVHAVIDWLEDDKGHQATRSVAQSESTGWDPGTVLPIVYLENEAISFSVLGYDEDGAALEYRFILQRTGEDTEELVDTGWVTRSDFDFVFTEDFTGSLNLLVYVRDDNGQARFEEQGYDDAIIVNFSVVAINQDETN